MDTKEYYCCNKYCINYNKSCGSICPECGKLAAEGHNLQKDEKTTSIVDEEREK